MKLNLAERFIILQLLPSKGNFALLKIINNAKMALSPSDEEFSEFEITYQEQMVKWNQAKGLVEKEISLSVKAVDVIRDALKELDNKKELDMEQLTIYEKFMEE